MRPRWSRDVISAVERNRESDGDEYSSRRNISRYFRMEAKASRPMRDVDESSGLERKCSMSSFLLHSQR